MMDKLLLAVGLCLLSLSTSWAQRDITLEDIWKEGTYSPNRVAGFNFLKDGQHFTRLEDNRIIKYDIRSGKETAVILDGDKLGGDDLEIATYSFSEDEQKLILAIDKERIYRHSYLAEFSIYDLETNELTPVYQRGTKTRLAALNPEGDKVAFVFENNLYYKDLNTSRIVQITEDGLENQVINGATDWVYEEEFGDDHGFFWSPNGEQIAFYRFDETAVKEFTMTNYREDMYPEYVTFKYPKVGETNSTVSVHMYDLAANTTKKVVATDTEWEYFPRIKWTAQTGELCVFQMNRHQSRLQLNLYTYQGDRRILLTEENDAYVELHDYLTFLENGKQFVWVSEQDGWNHVYLYNMDGTLAKQVTNGKWDVTSLYGVDQNTGTIIYQAAMKSPMQREVYTQNWRDDKGPRMLAGQAGTNSAKLGKHSFDYFVLTHSTINTPPTYTVVDRQGKRVRFIEDNADLANLQQAYRTSRVEFFSFPTVDGTELNGYMVKPANFNPNVTYPLLMYVYGGPGSQTAKDSWGGSNYWWFQMLAQKGFIVASVDNRGTGARGEEFKKMTYQQLGKYETEDQIAAARYLGGQRYIDAKRMSIFGWSYGGYMSSLAILKGADVFKAAIAVAPVTNWKWYDNIYTERYMRTVEENEGGYAQNSPINFADQLKGDYLLIHGLGDDNVHFQHTAEMTNALISANKQFDTYFYPNRNHGIYGDNARLHLYTKMTQFLMDKVKGEKRRQSSGPTRLMATPMEKRRG